MPGFERELERVLALAEDPPIAIASPG